MWSPLAAFLIVLFCALNCPSASCAPEQRFTPLIVGGKDTSIDQFPHQVSIEVYESFLCGGSILSENWIVSAAHSFRDEDRAARADEPEPIYSVRVSSSHREKGGQVFRFGRAQIVLHPEFDPLTLDFDVAVLHLSEEIAFGAGVAPISLVAPNQEPREGDVLTVTGFGRTSLVNEEFPDRLQMAIVPKRDPSACQFDVSGTLAITASMLCAGDGKSTPFHGDSGGPLINNERQLVGIVSWGPEPRRRSERRPVFGPKPTPAVYVNIANSNVHKFITDNAFP